MIQLIKPFWLTIAPQSQFKIQSIQEFYYALSLPKTPKTSLTLFFRVIFFDCKLYRVIRNIQQKRQHHQTSNSGSCSLVVASKKEKTFLNIITSLGVRRSSIKWRMVDSLVNHLAWWIQLENRFLGLDTSAAKIEGILSLVSIAIWNILQIRFWHSSKMVWHIISFRVCPNSKCETIRDVEHVKFLLNWWWYRDPQISFLIW